LIGIGLARFAYTPLLPVLIQEHWFSASAVVYLGAANLVGYLIGAMLGRPFAARLGNVTALRAMKVLVTLAFLACAFPVSTSWFFVWRLLSGVAGCVIMVLVAATILPHVPASSSGLGHGSCPMPRSRSPNQRTRQRRVRSVWSLVRPTSKPLILADW